MSDNKISPEPFIPKKRLETLTDGIFAIAMTLLVLSIEVPTFTNNTASSSIPEFILFTLIPQLAVYMLSFVLLTSFWMVHHVLYAIKSINTKLLWINAIWLMSIAIVPFSTSLVGKYGELKS